MLHTSDARCICRRGAVRVRLLQDVCDGRALDASRGVGDDGVATGAALLAAADLAGLVLADAAVLAACGHCGIGCCGLVYGSVLASPSVQICARQKRWEVKKQG